MPDRRESEDQQPKAATSAPSLGEPPNGEASTTDKAREIVPIKRALSLAALATGMPGLTAASGQVLAEAAAVCLEDRRHLPGVRLPHTGLMREDLFIDWPPVDEQSRRCYADMQEATERGACGVAILVVREVTGLVVVERSKKGTGFDYWLGEKDYDGLPFVGTSRLKVSGILTGTKTQVASRIREKKNQMNPTDQMAPGFVAVVEFGTPIACVESK